MLSVVLFATSCDPDVAGEKITLPPMEFAFKVSPDTSFLRVGDTFSMHASLSTTLWGKVIIFLLIVICL
jgi:hypothetical protein